MNPQEFTTKLKEALGDNLQAVILYGSAAAGEFQKGHSDMNTIVILKNHAPAELAKTNRIVKKWMKRGNPVPLFFTDGDVKRSADVFPIEFSDIKERRKLLYGTDPFEDIVIDLKNLRHQCEHELRSKLLALYGNYTVLAGDLKAVIRLILESSSSIFSIFKGVLRLAKIVPREGKKEMIEQLENLIGANLAVLFEIMDVRAGNIIWRKETAAEKIEQYLTSIETVVRYVDNS